MVLLAAKIVDDLQVTVPIKIVDKLNSEVSPLFELGTISHGPGRLRINRINKFQNEDFICSIDAEEMLTDPERYPLTRFLRRETNFSLNAVQKSAFMSVNSSLGWLGLASSPFCAFYEIYLQQFIPAATVSVLILQSNALSTLNKLGTCVSYPLPINGSFTVTIVVFTDSVRLTDHGSLSFVSGFLLGPLKN